MNPACGIVSRRRVAALLDAISNLGHSGHELFVALTSSPGEAASRSAKLLSEGCDTIIACGGDGTVNEVLQGIAESDRPVRLGVVPLGSGNLLAQELGIHGPPAAVVLDIPRWNSIRVPLAIIESGGTRRYWTVAAGIGADARVICNVRPQWKRRLGLSAYYVEATRQVLSPGTRFPWFEVRFTDIRTGTARIERVTQLIATRIRYFAHRLAPAGEGLPSQVMQLVLFKSNRRWIYMNYGLHLMTRDLGSSARRISHVEVTAAASLECGPIAGDDLPLAEVDGELVGTAPLRIAFSGRQVLLLCSPRQ